MAWSLSHSSNSVALVPCQPHNLTSMQIQFLCDCVKQQPDMALAELQMELSEVCGVDMSVITVTHSL